jgi:hypothetical protein
VGERVGWWVRAYVRALPTVPMQHPLSSTQMRDARVDPISSEHSTWTTVNGERQAEEGSERVATTSDARRVTDALVTVAEAHAGRRLEHEEVAHCRPPVRVVRQRGDGVRRVVERVEVENKLSKLFESPFQRRAARTPCAHVACQACPSVSERCIIMYEHQLHVTTVVCATCCVGYTWVWSWVGGRTRVWPIASSPFIHSVMGSLAGSLSLSWK